MVGQVAGDGLGLAAAAVAEVHVGFGAVEDQGVGGLGVTEEEYTGWHDSSSLDAVGLLSGSDFV
jgi:hypothetical protein